MPEAVTEALRSDGTAFTTVGDSNITAGLLLTNGKIYVAFGSNGCNGGNYSWVLAYDATTLQQVGTFNAAPGKGLASIWQSGGPATDDLGNLYVSTSESTFNANVGGQDYGSSILKLNQSTGKLDVAD